MMTDENLQKAAYEEGFHFAVFMDVKDLVFEHELRKYCVENLCGNYGCNYACPPDCGTPEELEAKAKKYRRVLVLETIYPVKDLMDNEETQGIRKKHNQRTKKYVEKIEKNGMKGLPVMAGPCTICEKCARLENKPCRFPDKLALSLSSYCINTGKMAEHCNLPFVCGNNEVAFFSLYLMD